MSNATEKDAARQVSYAHYGATWGGKAMIRLLENASGRLPLIRRARGYRDDITLETHFWQVMLDRFGITPRFEGFPFEDLPKIGPLVVVSNHPFGILDGMILGWMLRELRGDFRIIAHQVFDRADELNDIILPINFDGTKDALRLNLQTRKDALTYLGQGGCIGIFPGGTVSTSRKPFGPPMDPAWKTFTAKMITKSRATVLPLHFRGCNSRLFQLATHTHYTLRTGLLIHEFCRRVDQEQPVVIGAPLTPGDLAPFAKDPSALMAHLWEHCYALGGAEMPERGYGYDFEEIATRKAGN